MLNLAARWQGYRVATQSYGKWLGNPYNPVYVQLSQLCRKLNQDKLDKLTDVDLNDVKEG